jgi:hypothetical protein
MSLATAATRLRGLPASGGVGRQKAMGQRLVDGEASRRGMHGATRQSVTE